jgi:hypothetical protein
LRVKARGGEGTVHFAVLSADCAIAAAERRERNSDATTAKALAEKMCKKS